MSIVEAIRDLNLCNEVNSSWNSDPGFRRDVKAMLGLTPRADSYTGRDVLYRDYARQLVEKHGKPATFKAVYRDSFSTVEERATLRDVKKFKRWLVKEGQAYKKTYGDEPARFATRCDGTGAWTGFSFLVLSRTYMNAAFRVRHAHKRDIDVVQVESNISCFFDHRNLLQKGIDWRWLMAHGPLEAIRAPLLMRKAGDPIKLLPV